jgi:hypothetical protein
MNKYLISAIFFILSLTLILSSCKKEEDTPIEIPDPDPTIDFVGNVGYISSDTELAIGSPFNVGIVATNAGSDKKLVSFIVVRTFEEVADTVVNHTFYSQEFSWESEYISRSLEGEELWSFSITDEKGKTAMLSFVITTIDPKPSIAFLSNSGYVSGDTLLDTNAEFMVGISAASSESGIGLAKLTVLRNFEHSGPEVMVDSAVSGQNLSWDSTFMANTYAGYESWTFIIIDMAGEYAEISFLLKTEEPGGGVEVVSFPDICLGSYNDLTYGGFFSTSTGMVYNKVEAGQNQVLIDFAFYLGATHGPTLGAPSSPDVQTVWDLPAAGWTIFNQTLFKEATISAKEFDAIGSHYTFPPFSGGEDDIKQLEIDDVVFFKTTNDKRGYIKVNDFNWKGDHIKIDVKVEL